MSTYNPAIAEPRPAINPGAADVQSLVMADIAARREVGIQRYGTALQAHNGRNARRDAYVEALRDAYDEALDLYDEALDLACHLRQLLEEQAGGD